MRAVLATALAATLLLSACGSDGDGTATDPGGSTPPSPTVGTYPSYGPEDYRFTLTVSCFCAGAGTPIRVTVVGDEITDAVYTRDGRGVHQGDEAGERFAVTIDQVIDAANDTDAASVQVRWPDGQDYPSSVVVDRDEQMVDDEVGYAVSDVVVG